MLVATAGHIDHGKTTLVRALTGVDTDRLPEEKARGISIDLGFAYRSTAGGQVIGFVDVPGHERFVRNMLAGVCAIDFALLVVAADDGIMPQTREHLQILDLLGVKAGLAVVSKTDRVGAARVAAVSAELAALLAPTSLAGAPVLPVSAVGGDGIAALHAALEAAAAAHRRHAGDDRNPRYVIDRAFSVAGTGTVLTGTVLDGQLRAGDKLLVSPAGLPVRVRAVHQQGRAVPVAAAGERCAVHIAGADPQQAGRGNWLVAAEAHWPCQRFDAHLRVLSSEAQALRHWTALHLHVGTAEVTARLISPGPALAPGERAVVQLALDHPVAVAHGDRFIVRDKSARRTIGGGSVIDPHAAPSRRGRGERQARLLALDQADPEAAFRALLDGAAAGVDADAFQRCFNLRPSRMQALLDGPGVVVVRGPVAMAYGRQRMDDITATLLRTLREFHAATPHAPGMDVDALCKAAVPELAARVALSVLRAMAERRAVEISGSLARLPSHAPMARPGDTRLWAVLEPLYREWQHNVPQVREIATRTGLKEAQLRDFFQHGVRVGHLVRVSPERIYLRSTLAELARRAVALAAASPQGRFGVADFRDYTGIGRNLSIEILECLDRLGVTLRTGNVRSIARADALDGQQGPARH